MAKCGGKSTKGFRKAGKNLESNSILRAWGQRVAGLMTNRHAKKSQKCGHRMGDGFTWLRASYFAGAKGKGLHVRRRSQTQRSGSGSRVHYWSHPSLCHLPLRNTLLPCPELLTVLLLPRSDGQRCPASAWHWW